MRMSDAIDALATALAKAQATIKGATKDATNPHFKQKYADLAAVREACFPALTAHGLSVVQGVGNQDSKVRVTTMLLHESGQWLSDDLLLTPRDDSPQAVGSCITYGRRYGLMAIAGVAPEDDDAEAAQPARGPAASSVPAGYDEWWADMTATADTGVEALADAWEKSSRAMQEYTIRVKKTAWEALKSRARAVAHVV